MTGGVADTGDSLCSKGRTNSNFFGEVAEDAAEDGIAERGEEALLERCNVASDNLLGLSDILIMAAGALASDGDRDEAVGVALSRDFGLDLSARVLDLTVAADLRRWSRRIPTIKIESKIAHAITTFSLSTDWAIR